MDLHGCPTTGLAAFLKCRPQGQAARAGHIAHPASGPGPAPAPTAAIEHAAGEEGGEAHVYSGVAGTAVEWEGIAPAKAPGQARGNGGQGQRCRRNPSQLEQEYVR